MQNPTLALEHSAFMSSLCYHNSLEMCFTFEKKLKLHPSKVVANTHLSIGIISKAEITLWKQYDRSASHALYMTLAFLATLSYFSQFSEVNQQLPETVNSQDCKTTSLHNPEAWTASLVVAANTEGRTESSLWHS